MCDGAPLSLHKPLGRRCDLGDEIADQPLVGQRRDAHLARLESRRAGIDGLAVEFHHTLLAGVGVDAGEADRQRRIAVDADPAQAVEHRLAALERHRVGLPAALRTVGAAPDFEGRGFAHWAATSTGAGFDAMFMRPLWSRTVWLTCHSGSMPG